MRSEYNHTATITLKAMAAHCSPEKPTLGVGGGGEQTYCNCNSSLYYFPGMGNYYCVFVVYLSAFQYFVVVVCMYLLLPT